MFAFVLATAAGPLYSAELTQPQTLQAALAAARGGERIELAAGDYGILELAALSFPSDVTIASADAKDPAVVKGLSVNRSMHIVLDGILFDYVATETSAVDERPFIVARSSHITIRNSIFDGAEVAAAGIAGKYGTGKALTVDHSDNVVIERNEFYNFWKALSVLRSADVVVRGNDVHHIRSDGFNFHTLKGLLVEGNHIHDFKMLPGGGDHRDMIQFWTVLGAMPAQDIVIRGNFLDAGRGAMAQSIFMRNGIVDQGKAGYESYYRNVTIADNVIYNAHANGIIMGATDGLVIRNNTIVLDAAALSGPEEKGRALPRLLPVPESVNVVIEKNILLNVFDVQPGWDVRDNVVIPPDVYGSHFVNAHAAAASLADLQVRPGIPIRSLGVGAAMTRSNVALDVGPARR